jgi:hypothetical protein
LRCAFWKGGNECTQVILPSKYKVLKKRRDTKKKKGREHIKYSEVVSESILLSLGSRRFHIDSGTEFANLANDL